MAQWRPNIRETWECMMDNTDLVQVTLELQQWNAVVGKLMDTGPYREVAPLIGAIVQQCSVGQQAPPKDVVAKAAAAGLQPGPRLVVADGPPPGIIKPTSDMEASDGDHSETAPGAAE
jgi:hypothetical protein